MNSKPNIMVFFTDDQRFDTIAALGNNEIKTPNIDELVKSGTTFTNAHIPGGTVGAVCMPSRAMLHTGRTLFHLENNGETIPQNHALMGEVFKKAGYQTFGTGKWHNGTASYARSFTDGGEIFFGGMHDHWNIPACDFAPDGNYDKQAKMILNPFYSNTVTLNRCDHIRPGKHSSELFCDAAAEWLDKYDSQDPFFMYISFMAPHDPRSMPKEFLNMYDPDKIELPENFMEKHPFDYGVQNGRCRDEMLAPYPRTPDNIRKQIAEYYGMISHLDNELGKVIQSLKKSGKYQDTIIVFAGDNGLALGQHGLMGKQNCYEHSIRVPLIFAGPSIEENKKRNEYCYLLDIFPTICELTGIDIPETVEGMSLVPLIRNKNVLLRKTLYFAYSTMVRGVKNDRYKLIKYCYDDLCMTQLYDLKNDPKEINNLYEKEGYEEIISELEKELLFYKEKWDDAQHPIGEVYWKCYETVTNQGLY